MSEKPDHIILHVRTNDLNSNRALDLIAKPFADLPRTRNSSSQNVSISNIITLNDKFNDKAKVFCMRKTFFLIDQTKSFHPRNIKKVSCISASQ